MTLRAAPFVAVIALTLGACAGSKSEAKPEQDLYFTLPLVEGGGTQRFPAVAHADSFRVDVSVERANGSRLAAPSVVVRPARLASVVVGQGVQSAADVAARGVADGMQVALCVTPAADGGVTLGFRAVLTKSRKDGAETERAEAAGTRWIEPGVLGMLARVTSPDGSGPLLVLACVTPMETGGVAAADERDVRDVIELPMSGHTRHLRVSTARVARDFEPGTVLDETAAPDLLKAADGRVLHDFELFSCLDRRVRLAGITGPDERGFVAEGDDDGLLLLSWKTTGSTHTAKVRPNAGRRFVALARVEGGGTAGVIVSVDSD